MKKENVCCEIFNIYFPNKMVKEVSESNDSDTEDIKF